MISIISLNKCPENTRCIIVESDLPDSFRSRLMGLGWLPGREIKVLRKAPFGDPTIYLVDSTEISLREDDSKLIKVEPVYPAPLSIVSEGRYIVLYFEGGRVFAQKINSLGIKIGQEITVLPHEEGCKINISVGGENIFIGYGMANKIFVEKKK
ncbi:FeoA family protein [Athalassotoga saccharophila]|uniref:FeoA family protein n=1 Tax=Athalassotoga saccharophila TaxID=1441386 RepID=UPI00137B0A2C|nr:FeoA family protein [Athalassotoga saccharophila]BBJ28274.1 FeoA family protein [Athalassotoga saccharophila]